MRPYKLTNTAQQPATEAELVEALLAFANGTDVEFNGIGMPPAPAGFALPADDLWGSPTGSAPVPSWETTWKDKLDAARADLRTRLDEVMKAPETAAARAVRNWHWQRVQAVLRLAPGGLRLAVHYPATGVEELCDIGTTLLLDLDRGLRRDLCKCQLETCGSYFLVERGAGNRPRTRYCSTAHMLAFHGGDRGAARVRKHRSQKAEKRHRSQPA